MSNLSPKTWRDARSPVVRTGRLSKGAKRCLQDDILDHYRLFPSHLLNDTKAPCAALASSFQTPLVLDVGFGLSDSLLMAQSEPQHLFVGVETYPSAVARAVRLLQGSELNNLKLYDGNIWELLPLLQAHEAHVARVQLYFPDPWPKKRHHKRRLFSEPYLALLRPLFRQGSVIHIATDWAHYAESIQELMEAQASFVPMALSKASWSRPRTPFEAKATEANREITELLYCYEPGSKPSLSN